MPPASMAPGHGGGQQYARRAPAAHRMDRCRRQFLAVRRQHRAAMSACSMICGSTAPPRDSGYGKAALTPRAPQPHTVRWARRPPAIIPVRARAPQTGPMPRAISGCSAATVSRSELGRNSTISGATTRPRGLWTWVGRLEHCGQRRQLRHAGCRRREQSAAGAYRCDQLGRQCRGLLAVWRGAAQFEWQLSRRVSTTSGATTRPPDCGPGSAAPSTPNAAGVYGTQGTAAAGNVPGARMGGSAWLDASGNVWLFGGLGLDRGRPGSRNTTTCGSTARQRPVDVGRRLRCAQCRGRIWHAARRRRGQRPGRARLGRVVERPAPEISGCSGATAMPRSATSENLNDLWEYNLGTGVWTWIGGSSSTAAPGNLRYAGHSRQQQHPRCARTGGRLARQQRQFLAVRRLRLDSSGEQDDLNDLWSFTPTLRLWTVYSELRSNTGATMLRITVFVVSW